MISSSFLALYLQYQKGTLEQSFGAIETEKLPTIMSRASKTTLALTGLGTAGIVCFVHWSQEQERAVCLFFSILIIFF